MLTKQSLQRYRRWYARLLRLYPAPYYDRFGDSMEQTFADILSASGSHAHALGVFSETFAAAVRENILFSFMKNARLYGILLAVACLLLVPLIAMQFTTEVAWTVSDFIFTAIILGATGTTFELAMRRTANTAYRVAFGMGLAGAFLLIWMNGAVGLIGNENNPANLLYGAVLAVGFIGSLISRFKPAGMSRTLFAAAIVQACVPFVALAIWQPSMDSADAIMGIVQVLVLNAFFVALFAGSGILFKQAATHAAQT